MLCLPSIYSIRKAERWQVSFCLPQATDIQMACCIRILAVPLSANGLYCHFWYFSLVSIHTSSHISLASKNIATLVLGCFADLADSNAEHVKNISHEGIQCCRMLQLYKAARQQSSPSASGTCEFQRLVFWLAHCQQLMPILSSYNRQQVGPWVAHGHHYMHRMCWLRNICEILATTTEEVHNSVATL